MRPQGEEIPKVFSASPSPCVKNGSTQDRHRDSEPQSPPKHFSAPFLRVLRASAVNLHASARGGNPEGFSPRLRASASRPQHSRPPQRHASPEPPKHFSAPFLRVLRASAVSPHARKAQRIPKVFSASPSLCVKTQH